MNSKIVVGPQPGPQTAFLASHAHITIYGGAAGGGKSYGLLLDPLRHNDNADFGAVIFRRTSVQIRNQGGLWDESAKLYSLYGYAPYESSLEWEMTSGARVKFAGLEYDKTVYDWQGSQIPMIGFDELTHFSMFQFFYMMSRNRSASGVPGYIRATTNPDPDSWVRKFIDWWIGPDGFPIADRSSRLRWFIRIKDTFYWGNSEKELKETYGKYVLPKSVTFIAAKLSDNKILERNDPSYRSNLEAQGPVDRARLLDGNWNIRASAGNVFRREWFTVLDVIPAGWKAVCRYWDRAGTKPNPANNDPDWTRGLKMYSYPDGTFVVADLRSLRDTSGAVEHLIKNVASQDGLGVRIRSQQDPGSAGKGEAERFIRLLAGHDVRCEVETRKKFIRAKGYAAQCEAGNVRVLRAPWNEEFFAEHDNFSENDKDYAHDDIVDCGSGAFNELCEDASMLDVNDGLANAFGLNMGRGYR